MSQSSDPGIVRLDPAAIQTARGAFNIVDTLVVQEQAPVGGFDPVRLFMLRDLIDLFGNLLQQDTSGEVRLTPTERETARQAIGAVESLLTTAAGQQTLQSIGVRRTRQDIEELQAVLDRIQPVREADDLAGTDIDYRLYLDPASMSLARVDVDGVALRSFDPAVWSSFTACDTPTTGANRPIYHGYLALSIAVPRNRQPRGTRQQIAETVNEVIDELAFRAKDNRCWTDADRRRLELGAKMAAKRYNETGTHRPVDQLADLARWTAYRVQTGLANSQ